MFKKIAVLLLCLNFLITACKTVGVDTAEKANIKNILVVSSFGPVFGYTDESASLGNRLNEQVDVTSWQIDSFISQVVVQKLQAKGYHAVAVPYTANDTFLSDEELAPILSEAKAAGYDSLISLDANRDISTELMMPHFKNGYGVMHRSMFGIGGRDFIYSGFSAELYDVTSSKRLARSTGTGELIDSPIDSVDINWVDTSFDGLSDADKSTLQSALKTHIEQKIDFAISGMKL